MAYATPASLRSKLVYFIVRNMRTPATSWQGIVGAAEPLPQAMQAKAGTPKSPVLAGLVPKPAKEANLPKATQITKTKNLALF